jgi:hypothetical protein
MVSIETSSQFREKTLTGDSHFVNGVFMNQEENQQYKWDLTRSDISIPISWAQLSVGNIVGLLFHQGEFTLEGSVLLHPTPFIVTNCHLTAQDDCYYGFQLTLYSMESSQTICITRAQNTPVLVQDFIPAVSSIGLVIDQKISSWVDGVSELVIESI